MNTVKDTIYHKLETSLHPVHLEVHDESHHHAGHAGARPEGETHFYVHIVSAAFEGLPRVKRHQRIYHALEDLMNNPIHALRITADTPSIDR